MFDKLLTFSTIRQAGHMYCAIAREHPHPPRAPYTQPLRALEMFTKFLNNEPL